MARLGEFVHLNKDILCAVDCETTGLIAGYHDLVEIAIIPLTNLLEPDPGRIPFHMLIQPKRLENIDYAAMSVTKLKLCDIMDKGFDSWTAADLFDTWKERLQIGHKRIVPLGHNYQFDKGFIVDWLSLPGYEDNFSHLYRDTMIAGLFINDRCDWHKNPIELPKVKLVYLCSQLGIPHERTHNALDDALLCAKVYKRLLSDNFGLI